MGLLDDAIREHLEVKREHGADPEDVARQEQEALGPGQRNEFAQPDAPEDAAPPEDAPAAVVAEPPVEEPAPPMNEPPPDDPEPEVAAVAAGQEEDPWLGDDPDKAAPAERRRPPREPPRP